MIAEVARRHDSKRTDGRQRAALGATKRVLPASGIVDNLSVGSARQVEVPHEYVARIETLFSIARVAIALDRPAVPITVSRIIFGVVASRTGRRGTAPQRDRALVVTITPVVMLTVAWIAAPARIVKHVYLR
jgi:hypothetical protein